jgi:hypothetical protein
MKTKMGQSILIDFSQRKYINGQQVYEKFSASPIREMQIKATVKYLMLE